MVFKNLVANLAKPWTTPLYIYRYLVLTSIIPSKYLKKFGSKFN